MPDITELKLALDAKLSHASQDLTDAEGILQQIQALLGGGGLPSPLLASQVSAAAGIVTQTGDLLTHMATIEAAIAQQPPESP